MRRPALLLLALLPFATQAQMAPAGMKDMIVTGGLSAGKTYQVAEHCGASADTNGMILEPPKCMHSGMAAADAAAKTPSQAVPW